MQPIVIISVVVIDHIIARQESETLAPDLGLVELTDWLAVTLDRASTAGRLCFCTPSSTSPGPWLVMRIG